MRPSKSTNEMEASIQNLKQDDWKNPLLPNQSTQSPKPRQKEQSRRRSTGHYNHELRRTENRCHCLQHIGQSHKACISKMLYRRALTSNLAALNNCRLFRTPLRNNLADVGTLEWRGYTAVQQLTRCFCV